MPGFRTLIHFWGYGDHRGWKALDTWAEQISRELDQEASVSHG
ncbi:hypothetical protein [Streptomyces scabichelini]|nr:hypothetical protein [Streptomyces scabichelini]